MPETLGTLNLKIARLEQGLKVLEQQQAMSRAYPDCQARLARQYACLQSQLWRLVRHRRHLAAGEINTIN